MTGHAGDLLMPREKKKRTNTSRLSINVSKELNIKTPHLEILKLIDSIWAKNGKIWKDYKRRFYETH